MSLTTFMNDRPIQTKAFNKITELLQTRDECLVKMFCGTGKSRVIQRIILERNHPLSVVVFPSLALIRQFTNDYLGNVRNIGLLNVSSEELAHITSTTDPAQIRHFLNNPKTKHQQKIICVTYQSLDVLLSSIGDTKIGIACFDEAHRTTSENAVKLVYGDEYRAKYEKRVFFTATPVNANGITMFDRDRDEMGNYGDCGPLACEYTYLQGLRDAILSLFELRIDLYTQDTLGNMYESIARAILTTGNTRVLTFHADAAAESDSETSVLRFVDKAKFVEALRSVCAKEFPDKVGMFADERITFRAITATTKDKDAILGAFETCPDTEIYIVSSCRTIGEGVDTKKANMCVFVDPKTSPKDIIQNIGRISRKIAGVERQPATVLIPVCIGWDKYREAGDDPEAQDKLIREQLNDRENGDYNAIMNVCAALKQEDPELYELCLKYPSKLTESERKHALESQKKRNNPDDYVYREEIDELVEDGERVEIHTSNTEEPIIYRGFDEEDEEDERPIHRFYEVEEENEDGEMETRYHRIVSLNDDEEEDEDDSRKRLNPPKATNRPRMNIHTNDEIKLLWKMGDVMLGEQFGSGVLECEVERMDKDELWMENHGRMCEFIDEYNSVPNKRSKDPSEKKLGLWITNQKPKYNEKGSEFSRTTMKNPEIWNIWTDTLANSKYTKHLVIDYVQDWKNTHEKMCEFVDYNKKSPSYGSKNPEEKRLASWLSNQKCNYDPRGSEFSKHIMKTNPEIWQIWTDTLADPKYSNVLKITDKEERIQEWKTKHKQMCEFIDANAKRPSTTSKQNEEFILGRWTAAQIKNHNKQGSEFSKEIMKNPEIWKIWFDAIDVSKNSAEILKLRKRAEILKLTHGDLNEEWKTKHKQMCEFIEKNGRPISRVSKCVEEASLGRWTHIQKELYNEQGSEFSKQRMKNPEIWKIWTETISDQKYSNILKRKRAEDPEQVWKTKHKQMCEFIEKNETTPNPKSKDSTEKTLGCWVVSQKRNYDSNSSESSNERMKNPEIWQIWTNTLADERYQTYLIIDLVQYWKNKHKLMCEYIDNENKAPSTTAKDPNIKTLGVWVSRQKLNNYDPRGSEFSKQIMKTNPEIWQIWADTLADEKYSEALADIEQTWKNNHTKMCKFIADSGSCPSTIAKEYNEKKIGKWVGTQKGSYDPRGPELSKHRMNTNPEIWQIWTDTIQKYPCLKKQGQESPSPSPSPSPKSKSKISKKSHLIPKSTQESLECSASETIPTQSTTSLKRVIADSPYKLTGRAWATQKSSTTHEKLQSNPAEWRAYHAARDISFQGYADQSQIPRNRVIAHLGDKRKHRLRILDLGCGRNNIAQYYADADKDHKFTIQGYDHIAEEGSGALVGNIADLTAQEEDESADICIYSQSLMGSDWRDYLTEGHRMLRYNGEFIISEHIKMLDDVRAELGRLGCKVESVDADAGTSVAEAADASEADDKVAKWFVLVARKV